MLPATRSAVRSSPRCSGRYATTWAKSTRSPSSRLAATRHVRLDAKKQSARATVADHAKASNPALAFPCLDAIESKSANLQARTLVSGPEPTYTTGATLNYHCKEPLLLDWGGVLPEFDIAYETWGKLNTNKSNAILLFTGLSASSHAHSTASNPKPGWWEKMLGPGGYIDTNKYHVICTNVLGGCYGSTGPSSIDPADGKRYATRFPILTMEDMVRAQFRLLDHLGIETLYASVGGSMGGMQSLAAATLYPHRVSNIVSISGCARGHPYSMALRHTQRQILMMDPNWSRGFYYDGIPPHTGMKLAREVATVTYRSGLEWENRFGRKRADPSKPPALCPDFLIETYLDHAGEKFSLEFDANSMLYVSKAMDLFDLGATGQAMTAARRTAHAERYRDGQGAHRSGESDTSCSLTLPESPYQETDDSARVASVGASDSAHTASSTPPRDLVEGLQPLHGHPTLVIGVATDILFPAWQQREVAESLRAGGNEQVTHVELGPEVSLFGHDTFLIDMENIGGSLRRFLDKEEPQQLYQGWQADGCIGAPAEALAI